MTTEHPAVTAFREYLRVHTVQPNPDYAACCKFLKKVAENTYDSVHVFEVAADRPVVVMTLLGSDPSLPSVMLNSHMDVVPFYVEHWDHDPMAAYKDEDGNIYARGTQDMKCVGMQYMEAVRNLKAEGHKFLRTIHVVFVPDEEVGGDSGMRVFLQTPEFKALNVGFVLDEGLANEGNAFKVFYGERAPWWITVHCTGRTGHGSRFIEDLATDKLMRIIEKFRKFREEQKKMLDVGVTTDGKRFKLGDVTTVNLTGLSGGVQHNVIPTEVTANFDIRVAPTVDLNEFKSRIKSWMEPGCTLEFVRYHFDNTMTSIEETDPWWSAFSKACQDHKYEIETEIFPAATDSRFLREIGLPALGVSPINHTPVLLHDHNEFLNEKVYLHGIIFYEKIIPALANKPRLEK